MAAIRLSTLLRGIACTALLWSGISLAAQLPGDRADVMYHGYEGGGLSVGGPALLVRKGFADKVSVWSQYYVDMISSASIDVMSTASPYNEQRNEISGGIDVLHDRTTFGLGVVSSEESDYSARSFRFGISQDFFGDLTTVGLAYGRGRDGVRRSTDDTFKEDVDRVSYRVDLSQILTSKLIVNFNYEAIVDEGFLNNPYRSVRYLDPTSVNGFSWQPEVYPRTRTSSAIAGRMLYRLPYRAAIKGEYRYFTDSWGIAAHNGELAYTHPFGERFTVDLRYRYYTQGAADFYSDLYSRRDEQNFLARDKELSTFTSHTVGAALGFEWKTGQRLPFSKLGLNAGLDYMRFQYDDFHDPTAGGPAGTEPAYSFNAFVFRVFGSVWL